MLVRRPCGGEYGAGFRTVLTRCGESSTEREFRPHHVYGRRDRLVVGVESLSRHGLGFVSVLDVRFFRAVPSRSWPLWWWSRSWSRLSNPIW